MLCSNNVFTRLSFIFADERTKLINEVLNGIKVVKLYAWEVPLEAQVEKIRKQVSHK